MLVFDFEDKEGVIFLVIEFFFDVKEDVEGNEGESLVERWMLILFLDKFLVVLFVELDYFYGLVVLLELELLVKFVE